MKYKYKLKEQETTSTGDESGVGNIREKKRFSFNS